MLTKNVDVSLHSHASLFLLTTKRYYDYYANDLDDSDHQHNADYNHVTYHINHCI